MSSVSGSTLNPIGALVGVFPGVVVEPPSQPVVAAIPARKQAQNVAQRCGVKSRMSIVQCSERDVWQRREGRDDDTVRRRVGESSRSVARSRREVCLDAFHQYVARLGQDVVFCMRAIDGDLAE